MTSGKLVKARVCFGFVLQIFLNVEALIRLVLYFLSGSQPRLPRRGLAWGGLGHSGYAVNICQPSPWTCVLHGN